MKIKKFFFFLIIHFFSNSHVQLLIKLPTRERPEKFFEVLNLYYKNLSGKISYHFVISCDEDDSSMNCKSVINKLNTYKNLNYYFNKKVNKVEAINRDIDKYLDFDVLLLASDDMIPIIYGYDEIIVNNMYKFFPDLNGVLHFNDGRVGEKLNTIPIMGKKYYEKFNYVYFPGYKSVFCDVEMMIVSRLLNKVKYLDETIIRHDHPSFGFEKDSLYFQNESLKFKNHDFDLLLKRKSQNFNLSKDDYPNNKIVSTADIFGLTDFSTFLFSILIIPTKNSKKTFEDLYVRLVKQISKKKFAKQVEVLFFNNNEITNIFKRQQLIKNAKGRYYKFINENAQISDYYIKNIIPKILKNTKGLALMGIIKRIRNQISYNKKKVNETYE